MAFVKEANGISFKIRLFVFFLHQNQNIFSATLGIRIFFLEKNHNPPLQVKWSFPKETRFVRKKKEKYHCSENQSLNLNTERHRQTSL